MISILFSIVSLAPERYHNNERERRKGISLNENRTRDMRHQNRVECDLNKYSQLNYEGEHL